MRRFITRTHTAPADGSWQANDLPGTGRVDVVCRNLQAALFFSHGLRADAEFYAIFGEPGRTVRIASNTIQNLHPDERSTAARLSQALQDSWQVPDWKIVQPGLSVASFGLVDLLDDVGGTPVLLDPQGTPIQDWTAPSDPAFILSDHVPFTPEEYAALDAKGVERVSLGSHWYHGNHAIAVVNWHLDRLDAPRIR